MRIWFSFVAWVVGVAGLIVFALWLFAFDVWRIPVDDPMLSASLAPTLGPGDVVLVWRGHSIDRGQLMRCPDPQAPGRFVVARAMGGPGDQLTIMNETVAIDGRRTASPRACEQPIYSVVDPRQNVDVDLTCSVEQYASVEFLVLQSRDHPEPAMTAPVARGTWFLVSDDRHVHVDSRDYGPIDPAPCQHIVFRLVGPEGIGDAQKRMTVIW